MDRTRYLLTENKDLVVVKEITGFAVLPTPRHVSETGAELFAYAGEQRFQVACFSEYDAAQLVTQQLPEMLEQDRTTLDWGTIEHRVFTDRLLSPVIPYREVRARIEEQNEETLQRMIDGVDEPDGWEPLVAWMRSLLHRIKGSKS